MFWNGLGEVFPETTEARCWFHKIGNVVGALPKSAHPAAKKALAQIWNAEDKDHARTAVKDFQTAYGAKFPKAAAKITDDLDELLAFYDYPAEHWLHLRTTNPIESLNYQLRKVTKARGHFPGDDAVIKLLWLAIINIEDKRVRERANKQDPAKRSERPPRLIEGQRSVGWREALIELNTAYPERIK